MTKRNPKRKSLKRKASDFNLPEALRKKGIYTSRELVMVLLPYMEWIELKDLREKFWQFKDHKDDGPLRYILHQLYHEKLIDKKYSDPAKSPGGVVLSGRLFIMRTSRTCPRTKAGSMASKMIGTCGQKAEIARAKRRKRGKVVNTSRWALLTWDEYAFIRDNPAGLTGAAMAKTAGIPRMTVYGVWNHRLMPKHLKELPVR